MVNYKGGQYRVDTSIYLLFIFYFGKEYKLIKNKIWKFLAATLIRWIGWTVYGKVAAGRQVYMQFLVVLAGRTHSSHMIVVRINYS